MNSYEFDFIATSSLSSTEVENLINGLSQFFTENSAEVIKKEYWGLIDFQYRIRKYNKGHYFMFYVKSSACKLKEIGRKIKLNNLILRCMVIKITEKEMLDNMEQEISLKLPV